MDADQNIKNKDAEKVAREIIGKDCGCDSMYKVVCTNCINVSLIITALLQAYEQGRDDQAEEDAVIAEDFTVSGFADQYAIATAIRKGRKKNG